MLRSSCGAWVSKNVKLFTFLEYPSIPRMHCVHNNKPLSNESGLLFRLAASRGILLLRRSLRTYGTLLTPPCLPAGRLRSHGFLEDKVVHLLEIPFDSFLRKHHKIPPQAEVFLM